ncbi:MAG: helix-turn-helix domain-containing protein [Chloroflexi bacterium]|nr:helix-turn-helix domain-containing protein [Chloroflexota bacterium]
MKNKSTDGRWLSLQSAADKLGVHPSTLRRWSEEGRVVFSVTVGGHRRFAEQELDQFLSQHSRGHGVADGVGSGAWATLALKQTRQEVAMKGDAQWLRSLDDAARDQHRVLGRRLMGLTLQYVSSESSESPGAVLLLDEARAIGVAYAQLSRGSGVLLRDALEAALFFRDRLLEASWEQPADAHGRVVQVQDRKLDRRINALLNVVQLGMVEEYERA